ncbi:MAG: SDR family NAD(P)-dependent oxidoreductase [Pseudomonadota bacterium]
MVSGANRGIGAAVAKRLHSAGFSLSLGVRSHSERERLASAHAGERTLVTPYDAVYPQSAKAWVESTYQKFKRIDGVVNVAGVLRSFDFEADDEAILDELLDVNLKGPLRVMRYAFPYLRQSGSGRVVNIVSLSGLRVKGRSSGYAISKFAFQGLSQAVRFAGWEHGIRVSSLCPGFVNTDMVSHVDAVAPEDMTQPETIAEAVLLLLNLPNNASIATLPINCVLEGTY